MQSNAVKKLTYDQLQARVVHLEFENANLKKVLFGQKRERFVPEKNDDQLTFLGLPVSSEPLSETEKITYSRRKQNQKKKHPGRNPFPANLPRRDIFIEPEEDTTGMKKIGNEVTEELEYQPAKIYVNRYIRPKYARPADEGVIIGLLPTRPIEKGGAGPGLLAHIAISKFVDHIPLYRQLQQFGRLGIDIADSTIKGWNRGTAELIAPLAELMRKQVLKSGYLMVDETTIKVQDRAIKGKNHLGFYWVYHDPLLKRIFFDYRKGRGKEGPNQTLKNFKGYLQTDGYAGYNELGKKKDVTPLGCMAHARRLFKDAYDNDAERAEWILHHIQLLYKIEKYARESLMTHEKRHEERQRNSTVVMDVIKKWLVAESQNVLPKSPIGKAITYMLNQWPRLEKYLEDGQLEIDNNLVENAIRPIALGRKNYLFAGSHDGAKRAADLYTIMANAKLQGVEPFNYLRDILTRLPDHPYKKLEQLLPENWKKLYLK